MANKLLIMENNTLKTYIVSLTAFCLLIAAIFGYAIFVKIKNDAAISKFAEKFNQAPEIKIAIN